MKKILFLVSLFFGFASTAQTINIPDPAFKNALLHMPCVDIDNDYTRDVDADSNDDGEISVSEALAVTSLQLTYLGIQSLEGIQYFSNLQILFAPGNAFTTLDVSALTQLSEFDCSMSQTLHTLNLGSLPNLGILNCGANQLTSLDLSQTPNLWYFTCQFNQLTTLDLSALPKLKTFQCDNNLLTSIDLSNHFELTSFWCYENPLLRYVDVRNGATDAFIIFNLDINPVLETFCIDPGDSFTFGYNGPAPSFCALSTVENPDNKPIGFYPNPVNDRLHFNKIADSVELYDASGRLVAFQTKPETLDVSGLQSGIYILRYSIDGKSNQEKFVKK